MGKFIMFITSTEIAATTSAICDSQGIIIRLKAQ